LAKSEGREYEIRGGRPVWGEPKLALEFPLVEGEHFRILHMHLVGPSSPACCWIWAGATTNGHPVMRQPNPLGYGRGVLCQTRRLVYRWLVGPLLPGQKVRTTCQNKLCINPDHLTQGAAGRRSKK
jgi:hypothetical protein